MRSSRRGAAEHGASTSAEPAIWGRQAARQRSGWGQQDNGIAYRLLTDQLGSVRLVVRASDGNVVQHIDYDPWGVPTVVTGDWTVQSFGFAGGVYDSETELVRFGARDYDARVGRWTAKDPVRFDGGVNLYVYVGNDPIGFIDPTGLTTEACERPIDLDDVFKKTLRTFLRLNLLLSPLWWATSDTPMTEICPLVRVILQENGYTQCIYQCRGTKAIQVVGPGAECERRYVKN